MVSTDEKKVTGTYRGITYNREGLTCAPGINNPVTSISKKQAQNLIDLAAVLREVPPPEFDMSYFSHVNLDLYREDTAEKLEFLRKLRIDAYEPTPRQTFRLAQAGAGVAHTCGTSCCAIGTAAYHGIGKAHFTKSWVAYSRRAFGVWGSAWSFLFSGDWDDIDNTAEGAAARILYLLTAGLPSILAPDYLYIRDDMVEAYGTCLVMGIDPK